VEDEYEDDIYEDIEDEDTENEYTEDGDQECQDPRQDVSDPQQFPSVFLSC